jgi:hypothetical protein
MADFNFKVAIHNKNGKGLLLEPEFYNLGL